MTTSTRIEFTCFSCGRTLSAPGRLAGRIVRCPACKNVSPVPRPVEHTPEAALVKEEPIQLVDSDAGENGLTAVGITEWPKCMPRTAERTAAKLVPFEPSRLAPLFWLIVGWLTSFWPVFGVIEFLGMLDE